MDPGNVFDRKVVEHFKTKLYNNFSEKNDYYYK